ncbi:DNA adenine methylase [Erwinia sp. D4-22]
MANYRTPLRYPGGKQKLAPFILELVRTNSLEGGDYVEPYAGGAGVAMQLLIDGHVSRVHLNDSSIHIYAFWHSILNRTEDFCKAISKSIMTIDEWKSHREVVRHPNDYDLFELGFSTFYLNRTNRSGVLSGGVIGGLAQAGNWKLDARFPHKALIERIELIATKGNGIHIYNKDAEDFFSSVLPNLPKKTLMYCDPPYFEKASGLYLNFYKAEDHKRIANIIKSITNVNWVVSYDAVKEILDYYKSKRMFLYDLQYNVSKVYKGSEAFIFSDDLIVPENSSVKFIDSALKNKGLFEQA